MKRPSQVIQGSLIALLALIASAQASAHPLPERARSMHAERAAAQRPLAKTRLAIAAAKHPALAVVLDARTLERLYRRQGRAEEVRRLYEDLLAKSNDPLVREFAHRRIARYEMRRDNVEGAIDSLRRSLDENLRRTTAQ